MKVEKLVFIFCLLSLSFSNNGQSYLGYRFLNTEFGQYNEISGGTISTAEGDDGFENITLPFSFNFMGTDYLFARISVNGWLEMGQTYTGLGYENEIESITKKPLICPLWDDLYLDSLSEVRYELIGSYPARMFIIQWKNMRWRDYEGVRKNFQIKLWELDNTIDFIYGPGITDFGSPTYSIGLNNSVGGIGNFISVTPFGESIYFLSDSVANNWIEDISLLHEGLVLSFVPSENSNYGFAYEPTIIYQPPHYVIAGYPNQFIIVIIIPCHAGDALTSPWVTKFYFNTLGTTNNSDIESAKLFYTGSNPNFTIQNQLGSSILNPSYLFSIGGFVKSLINNNVSYFWLTYDLATNSVNGNNIDANCYEIDLEGCCPSITPDSSLASSHCVITGGIPVELTTFSSSVTKNNVTLNWQTATETNNQGFQIERRKTIDEHSEKLEARNEEWENIGFITGTGTTTETKFYSFSDQNLQAGKYQYRLKQIDFDGTFEYTNTIEIEIGIPSKFSLEQNYPNPFNPETKIRFSVPLDEKQKTKDVNLKVYDVLGNEVATLVNDQKEPGYYEVDFNASKFASGVYFYRLQAGDFIETKKMILLK